MYDIKGNIHDRYTLEFKIGFSRDSKEEESDFKMDTWVFIPDTLGINQSTYTKESFYRDFRTMVRLITPSFSLEDIANPDKLPLSRLEKWCIIIGKPTTPQKQARHEKMYEHQIKMFCSIVRSALRDEAFRIYKISDAASCKEAVKNLVSNISSIIASYRNMLHTTNIDKISSELRSYFFLGDEYLCRNIGTSFFQILDYLKNDYPNDYQSIAAPLFSFIEEDLKYENLQGYLLPCDSHSSNSANPEVVQNRNFIHRAGQLKKYVESDLWILAKPRSNTFLLQQFVFMIAAGVSMVFATVVSFSFQQTYGNFTLPLFIALVISYMFKDRTKELLRIWFATKLGSYMYEFKTKLGFSGEYIGWMKYGMDFVNFHKLPKEVLDQRGRISTLETGNMAIKENVIIYRQRLSLFGKKLARLSHYPLHGVNTIQRINLREFLRRMDSSHVPAYILDSATPQPSTHQTSVPNASALGSSSPSYHTIQAEKAYYVHFITRIRYQGNTDFKRFRVCMHRRGAVSIEEI